MICTPKVRHFWRCISKSCSFELYSSFILLFVLGSDIVQSLFHAVSEK